MDIKKAVQNDAMDMVFSNRGDTLVPCAVKPGELACAYRDNEYGTMVLAEMLHRRSRRMATPCWRQYDEIRFCICGSGWFRHATAPVGVREARRPLATLRAEFKVGIDSKTEALDVNITNPMFGIEDGKVLFRKVQQ